MNMKTMMIVVISLVLFSCSEDEAIRKTWCVTGIDKQTEQREFLRCQTQEQFNPTDIRSSQWNTTDSTHNDYRLEACGQCE